MSGVLPSLSCALMAAPFSKSKLAMFLLFHSVTAYMSGVLPSLSCALMAAPLSKSDLTISILPNGWAACMSGVLPSLSRVSMSVPCFTRWFICRTSPSLTACMILLGF